MTDKKITDREIIKALECCLDISPSTCKNCPLFNVTNSTMVCSKIATKFALDLINRQKAEIDQWKEEANKHQNLWCEAVVDIETAKAEAFKECIEKIQNQIKNNNAISAEWLRGFLNNLLKEKVSEDKVQWLKQGECPMTPEQFNAIYDDEETVGEDK